ncbi:MAG: S26 family signal peptidase [Gemmataceae bacterium]
MIDDANLRRRAVRRSWFCPGAGFALLGRPTVAVMSYAVNIAAIVAASALAIAPSYPLMWTLLALAVIAVGLWLAEQIVAKGILLRPPGPAFLVRWWSVAALGMWLLAIAIVPAILLNYGSMRVAGVGMMPTVGSGELVVYDKRVDPARWVRGAPIVFRLQGQTAPVRSDWPTLGRILAGPGDTLAIKGGRYRVNGADGPPVVPVTGMPAAIAVPREPQSLTVPDGCYFVVQDASNIGYDSRVLSWARSDRIVGDRLALVARRGLFRPIE